MTQSFILYASVICITFRKYMSLISQWWGMLLWQPGLCSEPGLSSIMALVLVLLFSPSSPDSPPFQLFGSLPRNPHSPTSESRRKARAKYRDCCTSLLLPPVPATLLPPSRDPQLHVHIFPFRSIAVIRTPNLAPARGLWLYTMFLPYRV